MRQSLNAIKTSYSVSCEIGRSQTTEPKGTVNSYGIVYVLTNPAMPGLVKIGKTARESVETHFTELYSTGVPVPFECAYAARVIDEATLEQAFHAAFGPYRLNPTRRALPMRSVSRGFSKWTC